MNKSNSRRRLKGLLVVACLAWWGVVGDPLPGLLGMGRSREVRAASDLPRQAMAVLQQACLQCHGEDGMSGLDLRTRERALQGGERGGSIRPGNAAQSLLFQYITGKASPRMPLGGELSGEQIDLLRRWIEEGATWPEEVPLALAEGPRDPGRQRITEADRQYWAFQPPRVPAIPQVRQAEWVANPIDAFILADLEANQLTPSAPADKRTLLRRVTYDLTGLPPTPAEIEAFLTDSSPEAYRKVIDRLLASPRYGERWAQHWLDVVRFAETNGFELDQDREQAWRYRDYVIRSLNEDKPYHRFLLEQLAGDEIAPDDFEMRVATGFLRAGPQHVVAGNQDEALNRQEWLTEVMYGVGNGILGLTVACARCHDHKFDPILQADYYRLQAFFAGSDNLDYSNPSQEEKAAHEAAVAAHKEKLKPIREQISVIEKPYRDRLREEKRAALEPAFAAALAKPADQRTEEEKVIAKDAQRMLNVSWEEVLAVLSPEDRDRRAGLRQQMHRLELFAPEPLPKALAVSDIKWPVPPQHILKAGDPHRPGAEVAPGFLTALLPPDAPWAAAIEPIEKGEFKATGRKRALAEWLIRPDHPLTARVIVNRLWHHHFGRGIVATPNDFGRNGMAPTHPALLDWLATELVKEGWSLKALHRQMLLSNTYQQRSDLDSRKAVIDPGNRWFWRMNRQRLDGEALRDAILAASGNLTEQLNGPPIRVPLEPEVYDTIFTEFEPDNLWPVHPDASQHTRRSLYLLRKRNVRLPMFVAFDSPDMMSSCGARTTSVHALQSLTLLNSEFMLQQSRVLAGRILREAGREPARAIAHLYQVTMGRPARADELGMARTFLTAQTRLIEQRRRQGEPIASLPDPPAGLPPAAAAAWVDLCLATMNLTEFLYVR